MTASNFTASAPASTTALRTLPTVLLAGPWDLAEFAIARRSLHPLDAAPVLATLDEAIQRAAASVTPPELVLVAAPRPGMVAPEHVERLGAVAPLARLVIVAGSWCEGEWRTGRPPAGAVRLYWHELGPWWRTALADLGEGKAPSWSAPLDEPRAGRTSLQRACRGAAESRGWVAVDAIDLAAFEALAAALAEFGWLCAWRPRGRREAHDNEPTTFSCGVWDGGQLDEAELQMLQEFCLWLEPQRAPVLALVDYPRAEHVMTIAYVGAAAIMGKPYQAAHLADELLRLRRHSA